MDTNLTVRQQDTAIGDVSQNAKRYARQSRASATVRRYKSAWAEFANFAEVRGEVALPSQPSTVIEYITALADAGQAVSTIGVKLAAIAQVHTLAGVASPTSHPSVKTVMSGIRRELKSAPVKKLPATLPEVRAMVDTLDLAGLKGLRDRALLLVGFGGAFRRSELVALDRADLELTSEVLRIAVRSSKTDQTGKGLLKTIPAIGGALCPVRAMREYLDAAGIASRAVFRRVNRWGSTGKRLTAQSVALVVKAAAAAADLDASRFAGHSLRSGFINACLDAGVSDADITEQTGQTVTTMHGYRQASGVGSSRAVRGAFGE